MKRPTRYSVLLLLGAALLPSHDTRAAEHPLTLWYTGPATQWVQALPIGNGRLGAMIFGDTRRERIQLNEDTLWAGGPYDPGNTNALETLPRVRQLIWNGNYAEAQRLAGADMMARPLRQMPYQTVGDLILSIPEPGRVEDYYRELNLDTAITRVSYTADGVRHTREAFASPVDQVIVLHWTADKPGSISFTASFATPQRAAIMTANDHTLILDGINGDAHGIKGSLRFQARVRVLTDNGRVSAHTDSLSVTNADSVTLLIAAATSYVNYHDVNGDPEAIARKQIAGASRKQFARLRQAHVDEHQRLFRRVELDLGSSDAMQRPTDERIRNFGKGNDPQLAALYFQFARYLLISSSRPGSQPANLQGIWNESMKPPWDSKYTININTEMNYWPAEVANLPECVEPLVDMVLDLTRTGARTAKVHYNARGWVAHHNTDLWRATGPIDGPQYGMWPAGGAWLCLNLWEHYLYNGDRRYLARIYPALKGACEFFLDTLVEEPTHQWLVTSPSLSPENRHPKGASICAGPTCDSQIIRDLFSHTIQAATILGRDRELRQQLVAARLRLAPNQIGRGGQLQEWLEDWDLEAPDQKHRHVSHLYGFFPSAQITLRGQPDLAAAVRKSLEMRGDLATGWAIAWRINVWARLQDAERTYSIIKLLLEPSRTYPNMFDAHPPFQIDGNFGGASGIAEMLLQSHETYALGREEGTGHVIELLPALPTAWPNGRVRGLRARGGFIVDIQWRSGQLQSATIRSANGNPCRLKYRDATRDLDLDRGDAFEWNGQ